VEYVTKGEFIDKVAERAQLSKKDAAAAVDAFLGTVEDALKARDSITFTGFGKFSTANRAARTGVNPRNPGQKVQIPAATVPKFQAGSGLKAAVK
jgi:DNA-binding protein HU-beta